MQHTLWMIRSNITATKLPYDFKRNFHVTILIIEFFRVFL